MLYAFLKPLAMMVMRLLFRLRARGRQHVPRTGPVLIAANHSSFLDPPIVGACAPRQVHFMAKAELFDVPFLGWLIGHLNARPIRRGESDPGAIRTALRVLREGQVLLVFPEGTRGPEGALRTPKGGAGMLAALSGAPVVPAYVSGSGRAWPRGARYPKPTRVRVTFGAPVRFGRPDVADGDSAGRKEYYESVSREIMAAIGRVRDETDDIGARNAEHDSRSGIGRPGGAGVGGPAAARRATKYIDGRNGWHGEG